MISRADILRALLGLADELERNQQGLSSESGRAVENQQRGDRITSETSDPLPASTKELFDFGGCAVSDSEPNHLRWSTENETPLPEVVVLGDDGEAMCRSPLPDGLVVGAFESQRPHVCRPGKRSSSTAGSRWGRLWSKRSFTRSVRQRSSTPAVARDRPRRQRPPGCPRARDRETHRGSLDPSSRRQGSRARRRR